MKKRILFLIFAITFLIGCNNGSEPKTPEQLKAELKVQEYAQALQYVQLENVTMEPNKTSDTWLFGAEYDGYLVAGTVKNTASLARFKDIVINVALLSQTETVIEAKDYVIYEFYEPNSSKPFSIKVNPPKATAKFIASVKSISPVY